MNLINAVLGAEGRGASADWLLVHVAADYSTLAVVRGDRRDLLPHAAVGTGRGSRGSRASDRDVSRGSAGRRRVLTRRARRRVVARRRRRPNGCGASSKRASARGSRRSISAAPWRSAIALRAAPELLDSLAPAIGVHPAGAGRVMLRTNLATRPFYNERAVHCRHRHSPRRLCSRSPSLNVSRAS